MKIGFIGSGKMAEAMLAAFLTRKLATKAEITACDVSPERRAYMKKTYGIRMTDSSAAVLKAATVIFLATKPQQLDQLLTELAPLATRRHLFISIAAGKKLAGMEKLVRGSRFIRVMPNLPCQVGEGMSAFCGGKQATAADRRLASRLLSSFGQALELPERDFDAVTAISGSGPAFFAWFLEQLVTAATAEGLTRDGALLLANQTMLGTARLLLEKKLDPKELVISVTSAKGTTAAGLAHLQKAAFRRIAASTIQAAARRSRELSKV